MGCGACCIWSLTTLVAGEVENKSLEHCKRGACASPASAIRVLYLADRLCGLSRTLPVGQQRAVVPKKSGWTVHAKAAALAGPLDALS